MRGFLHRFLRFVTRVLTPAFLEDRAQRVARGPVDAELARDLRERRTGVAMRDPHDRGPDGRGTGSGRPT